MNRRDALKSLTALAGAAGITVTPVTTHEAAAVSLVVLKTEKKMSAQQCAALREMWTAACEGTALQHVKTIVLPDGLNVEIVR
jgi:hypothetical protein